MKGPKDKEVDLPDILDVDPKPKPEETQEDVIIITPSVDDDDFWEDDNWDIDDL